MGNNKHVKEKEKTVSKPKGGASSMVVSEKGSRNVKQKETFSKPKGGASAMVLYEKDSKNVKQKESLLYKHTKVSVRKEEHVVMQRGKDVIVQSKVMVGHREEVTTNKEAARLIHKDNHKVRVQGNRPLLLK